MDTVSRLRQHLLLSSIDHTYGIMKEPSLKLAHVYCILNNLSAQEFGPLLEKYIINRYNYKKNSASDCTGDCHKNELNFEIKVSNGGKTHKKFNFVQIRPNQTVNQYILTAYYLSNENVDTLGELFIFRVSKDDMCELITQFGSYGHGTKKEHGEITSESINALGIKEYAIRATYGDKCWDKLLIYRIQETEL